MYNIYSYTLIHPSNPHYCNLSGFLVEMQKEFFFRFDMWYKVKV
jgi:hypothetical protein